MVAAFDGWNDACQSATNVIRHLVSKYRSLEVGHISRDRYYDYQTSRPMQCVIQDTRRILWPQTAFYDITVSDDLHLEVGHISRDRYYDYQTSRPMQCVIQDTRRILWPQTAFYDITVSDDLHLLAQLGPEPNYRWMDYVRETLHFAKQYDVSRIVTLGSMLAECPHTRDNRDLGIDARRMPAYARSADRCEREWGAVRSR